MPSIVWFRQDLRTADNPALSAAVEGGDAVIPVFIREPDRGPWPLGGAAKWWLGESLQRLSDDLERLGARLILRSGDPAEVLPELVGETGATAIHWNRRYEPDAVQADKALKERLTASGLDATSSNARLLNEPWEVSRDGRPFAVFASYYRAATQRTVRAPLPEPSSIPVPSAWPASEEVASWGLDAHFADYDDLVRERFSPGQEGARKSLDRFLADAVYRYYADRHRPDLTGTSRLSPHLRWGEISPVQVLAALDEALVVSERPGRTKSAEQFRKELYWREFAYHLLFHYPDAPEKPLRPEYEHFPWQENPEALQAWKEARTGYPLIDAAMRELSITGWMPNRMRMVTASFLVKDLLIPWQAGARWFWECLVDADLANNTLGWQWTAGCGADGTSFQRVFNPITQGPKFDPDGSYVRRWVPEVAQLPTSQIHAPWEAGGLDLRAADVHLGTNYPEPMVDHDAARKRVLEITELFQQKSR